MEDLIDIAILEQRRGEPLRPLEDYLAERKKTRYPKCKSPDVKQLLSDFYVKGSRTDSGCNGCKNTKLISPVHSIGDRERLTPYI
jgi:hypothetical protein